MKKGKQILGALLFITGVIILISSQSGIRGNVIDERSGNVGNILGLILVVSGILLMLKVRVEERVTINTSREFKKAIKRQDPRIIKRAISKV